MAITSIDDASIPHDMQVISSGIIWIASFFLSQMNKCCSCVIVLWRCLVSSGSSWGLDSSRRLHSCDTTTLGSPTVPSSSKGLSIGDLSLETRNVNDGVCCLSLGNYVPGESEASPNVDINVFTKTLILEIKHISFLFLPTTYNTSYIKSLKVWTRSNEHELTQEHSLSFINFYLHFLIWLNTCHLFFLSCLQLFFANLLRCPQIQF
jgi:hypothetical protein